MSRKSPKAPSAAIPRPAAKPVDAIAEAMSASSAAAAPAFEPIETPATAASAIAIEAVEVAPVLASAPIEAVVPEPETPIVKAAESAQSVAEEAASTVQKDVSDMATQFETPKMLNDVTDRAQSAVEKGQKFVAEIGDFGKGNVEAMVESGKIAAKGLETLGQDYADYTRRSFEGLTATMRSLASVKSPTEFMKLQSDFARQAFDGMVAQSSKNTEAMIKLASDAAQPLSNRFAVAVEKVKTAA